MESSHLPNSILEIPCVLCHPSLPASLGLTAKLLTTSKAVAAAASAARSNQLQELLLSTADSSTAQQAAAWMTKHADLLQGVHTLKLQLAKETIDGDSSPGSAGQSTTGLEQLLPALPASLQQLGLGVDTPDRLTPGAALSDSDRQWLLQLQRGVQMAHLMQLTSLAVDGTRFVIGEDTRLPPNLVNLRLPMVMHEKPLLQLTRLQELDVKNLDLLGAAGLAGVARCLAQLKSVRARWIQLEDAEAPDVISALAALPLKSLSVMSYGPPQPAAAGDVNFPAALGALLGQLTGLTSLELAAGAYRVADVAASLAHLTALQLLKLTTAGNQGGRSGLWGGAARYEALADAIAGLKKLHFVRAEAYWFTPGVAEAGRLHPVMRLQAATQLKCLDLCGLEDVEPADDVGQQPDWEALVRSMPGVTPGPELAMVPMRSLKAHLEQVKIAFSAGQMSECSEDVPTVIGEIERRLLEIEKASAPSFREWESLVAANLIV